MTILAIVPARAGSKGVKNKNKRLVGGRPLIEWTLQACENIDDLDVAVSTDDKAILEIAKKYNVIAHERDASIAGDTTPMNDVIYDALVSVSAMTGKKYEKVMLLQPTAPMRRRSHVEEAIQLARSISCDSVMSVYKVTDCHPARMYTLADSSLIPYASEPKGSLRQDLPDVYHRNGAIYLSNVKTFMSTRSIWGGDVAAYTMEKSDSVNIDDEDDLKIADFLLSNRK
ncbi:MAG: cytidylyltransferase domain-containing protein [Halodesulfovibrio sp.]|uniref:acylneuraminate cytidylyltransferase family protein n=1 Tax=Halodesulfovibrio sp. TaxID=1912772 RepID=UPI00359E2F9F